MTKGRSAPSSTPRTQKAVKGIAPLSSSQAIRSCKSPSSPSGGARRPAMPSDAQHPCPPAGLPRGGQDGLGMDSDGRTNVKSTARRPPLPSSLGRRQTGAQDRSAFQPPAPLIRQARVRSVSVDAQLQAPCITFEVPQLHRGEQFCRVRTQPPADVRRTRFGVRQVELVIYGPLSWRVGDTTTLELEPYGHAVGPRPRRGKRA
jgi:hypothetical protein